jgi:spore coat polysaccharide biosynthesis protein SpsF
MRSLKDMEADIFALLTDEESASVLDPVASEEGFEIFVGPREDVLKRYCLAARHYGVNRIIRSTGDNPLVSGEMGRAIVEIHSKENADLSHFLGLPLGTGVEVLESDALFASERRARDPFEREHITTFMYRNTDQFKVVEEECPAEYYLPEAEVSVDTAADYKLVSLIFRELFHSGPVDTKQLVEWLKANYFRLRRKEGEGKHTPVSGHVRGQWNRAS